MTQTQIITWEEEEVLKDSELDESGVDAILEQLQLIDADILATQARRDALVDNLDNMLTRKREERERILYLVREKVKEFVDLRLVGSTKKSIRFPHGLVGYRHSPGSIHVREKDHEKAVKWCSIYHANAVKVVRSVLVSELKGQEDKLPIELFEVIPPHDKFYIQTGVKEK